VNKEIKALAQRVGKLEQLVHKLSNAPEQHNGKPVRADNPTSEEHDAASGQTPSLRQVEPSPKQTDCAKKEWYKTTKGWYKALQVLGVVAGIGYALITYQQWRDLRYNFTTDERAWLHRDTDATPDEKIYSGSPLFVKATFINTGKTLARNIEGRAVLVLVRNGASPEFRYEPNPISAIGITPIFPGERSQPIPIYLLKRGISEPSLQLLTDAQVEGLRTGDLVATIYGRVEYEDVFHARHWFTFCDEIHTDESASPKNPAGAVSMACLEYNETDGN
jgi:hypothetical protein